ncbi:MAG: hypothetical protein VX112_03795 [Pseudomonadota bacterium]|nr:hypothetical protein [Pseudomonadota bacterium]
MSFIKKTSNILFYPLRVTLGLVWSILFSILKNTFKLCSYITALLFYVPIKKKIKKISNKNVDDQQKNKSVSSSIFDNEDYQKDKGAKQTDINTLSSDLEEVVSSSKRVTQVISASTNLYTYIRAQARNLYRQTQYSYRMHIYEKYIHDSYLRYMIIAILDRSRRRICRQSGKLKKAKSIEPRSICLTENEICPITPQGGKEIITIYEPVVKVDKNLSQEYQKWKKLTRNSVILKSALTSSHYQGLLQTNKILNLTHYKIYAQDYLGYIQANYFQKIFESNDIGTRYQTQTPSLDRDYQGVEKTKSISRKSICVTNKLVELLSDLGPPVKENTKLPNHEVRKWWPYVTDGLFFDTWLDESPERVFFLSANIYLQECIKKHTDLSARSPQTNYQNRFGYFSAGNLQHGLKHILGVDWELRYKEKFYLLPLEKRLEQWYAQREGVEFYRNSMGHIWKFHNKVESIMQDSENYHDPELEYIDDTISTEIDSLSKQTADENHEQRDFLYDSQVEIDILREYDGRLDMLKKYIDGTKEDTASISKDKRVDLEDLAKKSSIWDHKWDNDGAETSENSDEKKKTHIAKENNESSSVLRKKTRSSASSKPLQIAKEPYRSLTPNRKATRGSTRSKSGPVAEGGVRSLTPKRKMTFSEKSPQNKRGTITMHASVFTTSVHEDFLGIGSSTKNRTSKKSKQESTQYPNSTSSRIARRLF